MAQIQDQDDTNPKAKLEAKAEAETNTENALPMDSQRRGDEASFTAGETLLEDALWTAGQTLIEKRQPHPPETLAEDIHISSSPITEVETWNVGNVVEDRYEVKGVLGHGGMGTVFHVYDSIHNLDLAMKTPKIDGRNAQEIERIEQQFVSEALAWVGLGMHLNIVACCYVRRVARRLRIFIEYVHGVTLTDWLAKGKVTDIATALDIGIQICWGIAWAHKRGLIHQDIKPDNILVLTDGTPKITDFGLAKTVEGRVKSENKAIVSNPDAKGHGTPGYAAPEQWQIGIPITTATDTYALGVMMCDLLLPVLGFAKPQHGAESSVYKHSLKTHREASAITGNAYMRLVHILQRCIEDEPANRYPDALSLVEELREMYELSVGRPYPRILPPELEYEADGLNNQAFSLLELGRTEEAERIFGEALKLNPVHLEAIYNHGLLLWHTGRMTDIELLRQLEVTQSPGVPEWRKKYLVGLVHLGRGDTEGASNALKAALELGGENVLVEKAIQEIHDKKHPWGRCSKTLQLKNSPVTRIVETLAVLSSEGLVGSYKISSTSISHDGRIGLCGNNVGSFQVWDLVSGQCLRTFDKQEGSELYVAISSNGRFGLSEDELCIRLWNLMNGRCLKVFYNKQHQAAISADGKLAFVQCGKKIELWDFVNGRCVRKFEGHFGRVKYSAISADSRYGLFCEEEYRLVHWTDGFMVSHLRVWDLATGRCLQVLSGHTAQIAAIALSADGQVAVSGSWDQTIRVWDVSSGRCLRILQGHTDKVTSLAISADGKIVLSGSNDQTVRVWDVESGCCLRTFDGLTKEITAIAITAEGHIGLSGSSHALHVWQVGKGKPATYVPVSPPNYENTALFHSLLAGAIRAFENGRLEDADIAIEQACQVPGYEHARGTLDLAKALARKGKRSNLRSVWHSRTLEVPSIVNAVALSADSGLLLSGGETNENAVCIWDIENRQRLAVLPHTGPALTHVESVALSADGSLAMSGGGLFDESVRVWDVKRKELLRIVSGSSGGGCKSMTISTDNRFGLTYIHPRFIPQLILWDLSTGQRLRVLHGYFEDHVASIVISPDNRLAMSGGSYKTVRVWDLRNGQCLRTLKGHTGKVTSVAISANGQIALSGSNDRTVRVWDVRSGQCLGVLKGHTGEVASVAISADGQVALSGSSDRTVRVWDVSSGHCLQTLEKHNKSVTAVAISADGRVALTWDRDRTVCMWIIEWGYIYPPSANWDEGALPYLENFVKRHLSFYRDSQSQIPVDISSRVEKDFEQLSVELANCGYGWIRREGILQKLKDLTANEILSSLPEVQDSPAVQPKSWWRSVFIRLIDTIDEAMLVVLLLTIGILFIVLAFPIIIIQVLVGVMRKLIALLMIMLHWITSYK